MQFNKLWLDMSSSVKMSMAAMPSYGIDSILS